MRHHDDTPIGTGIPGLDQILDGGLTPDRVYLVEGPPGAGKTTLALQFLLEGVRAGEPVLYMTLSESAMELDGVARSHGWSLEGVTVREYVMHEATFGHDQVTMFHPAEVELGETLDRMLSDVDELRPARIVLDALPDLRLLAETTTRYRRQLRAFKQFFLKRRCTVLLLDDCGDTPGDPYVQSALHGVVMLEYCRTRYGSDRRRLRVGKLRGRAFRSGAHGYVIRRGGLEVFPRLVASGHEPRFDRAPVSSGIRKLDALLGGGPPAGTSLLLMGPAGAGKTTIAMQYAISAARRGERAAVFSFDERLPTLCDRLRGIGLDPGPLIAAGTLELRQVDPVDLAPGEFEHLVRTAVEADGARMVVIDSLDGYLNAMPSEWQLAAQLHELFAYLASRGVLSLPTVGPRGRFGTAFEVSVDASCLADALLLLRSFESEGRLRMAISVAKNRAGAHESTARELVVDRNGIDIGEPLADLRGALTGVPAGAGCSAQVGQATASGGRAA